MSGKDFVDYYEILQVNPHAEPETIARVYRHLAKRFHPDNIDTGDRARFDQLSEAHEVLTNPEKRAAYDERFEDLHDHRLEMLEAAIELWGRDDDLLVRERLLTLLYTQRRRDVVEPGLGEVQIERALGIPREEIAFHLWYLREKQWVERTDRGFAITALGIDQVDAHRVEAHAERQPRIGPGD